jgi:DNA mismatch endonuclease (patch repair protein)
MDHLSEQERSSLMAKVKGKNTLPEMTIRRLIHAAGFRYRLHVKNLPGSPDIVFTPQKKAIFINGCFWHAHDCRKNLIPKTRQQFWVDKFERNRKRDTENVDKLKTLGWSILVIWECEVKKSCISDKIFSFLSS